jgi:hypothetical protein
VRATFNLLQSTRHQHCKYDRNENERGHISHQMTALAFQAASSAYPGRVRFGRRGQFARPRTVAGQRRLPLDLLLNARREDQCDAQSRLGTRSALGTWRKHPSERAIQMSRLATTTTIPVMRRAKQENSRRSLRSICILPPPPYLPACWGDYDISSYCPWFDAPHWNHHELFRSGARL